MIKFLKRIFTFLLVLLIVFEGFVYITGRFYLNQAVWYNFSNIDDYKKFDNHKALASNPKDWENSPFYNQQEFSNELIQIHDDLETVAFAIIKDGRLSNEQYFGNDYNEDTISGSFSMAKSYVGALIGVALKQGKIKSLDQKVSDFLPSFQQIDFRDITIKHLLTMSSGLSWYESYGNPLANTTECYYGTDIQKVIAELKVISEPGLKFKYLSGDTQILGLILRHVYNKSLTEILNTELWLPIGATNDVLWSVDHNGVEKAFCCMSATAKDYARLGQLYLQKGNWGGVQLIDSAYIQTSIEGNDYKGSVTNYYGYQWWLLPEVKGEDIFYMRGIHGQYVITFPKRNIVLVRLGKKRGEKSDGIHPNEVYLMVKEIIKLDNEQKL